MTEIDLTGLRCPLPILKAKKALSNLAQGEQLSILATDESAPVDFELFCEQTGHILIKNNILDKGIFHIVIEHK